MSDQERIILSLRNSIPQVPCKHLCSDCCGHVPFSHWEWNQIPESIKKGLTPNEINVQPPAVGLPRRRMVFPLRYRLKGKNKILMHEPDAWMRAYFQYPNALRDNICVFLTQDQFGCTIYEHRPIVCRLFATILDSRVSCKHGCKSIPQMHWELGTAMLLGWYSTFELI